MADDEQPSPVIVGKRHHQLVRAQMPQIEALGTDEWWRDTVPMREVMRRRLCGLVQFIDKHQRKIVYTDFEDERGNDKDIVLPGFAAGTDEAKFCAKVRAFLLQHLDHPAVAKLRGNQPLTTSDLRDLEQLLVAGGVGGEDEIHRAAVEAKGLGLLVRFLIGRIARQPRKRLAISPLARRSPRISSSS